MTDLIDLIGEQLDSAPAPATARHDLDALLRDGRRARSRRRVAVTVGTAAAALVIGGVAWTLAPGGGSVATDDAPVADQSTSASNVDPVLEGGLLAAYDPDGNVVVADGWRVNERIANPMGFRPPADSVALELADGTARYWYLLTREESGSGVSSNPAQKGFATLEEWVADQVDANRPDPLMDALDLKPDGRLVSYDDRVVVVDQRTGVDLGRDFGPAEDTTVAELRFEGRRWFVSALTLQHGSEIGPAVDTPEAGTTLDSYVSYLRDQYASGEGVR